MDYGIISADDHVVEPPDVWTSRLPARYRDIGPHVVRQRVRLRNETAFDADPSGPWADIWRYEDIEVPMVLGGSCAGVAHADVVLAPVLFEEMRPGAFCQADRLTDMDINHVDASMCFPNMFVRFTGQRFSEAKDKDLALLCVQAYNDWMVDEWCAGSDER